MRRSYVALSLLILVAVGAGIILELNQTFRYTRFVQLCLLLLVFVASTVLSGTRARNWLVAACSITLGLMVVEGIGLAFDNQQPRTDDGGMNSNRPILGWGAGKPGVYEARKTDRQGRSIYDVHITIDKNLIRKTESAQGPGAYAFFGDSLTFGEGIEDKDTIEQSFADLLGRKEPVLNLAYSGWSPAQNLAALQNDLYAPLLTAPRRFILMTAAWHIERTSCKAGFSQRAPRYVLNGGDLVYTGSCRSGIVNALHSVLRRFALYQRLVAPLEAAPTRHDVETYLKIVETFVKTAKKKYGVDTTILFLPYGDDYLKGTGYRDEQLSDAFRKSGADVLVDDLPRIAEMRRYWIQGDGHPTGLANRARAKALLDHLRSVAPEALKSSEANAPAH